MVDRRDHSGKTALMYLCEFDCIDTVRRLIDYGASVFAVDRKKMTPLMYAALRGNVDIAALLLDQKVDVNAVDRSKFTALMHARDVKTVELLIRRGAKVNMLSAKKVGALVMAAKDERWSIVKMLIRAGADPNESYGR